MGSTSAGKTNFCRRRGRLNEYPREVPTSTLALNNCSLLTIHPSDNACNGSTRGDSLGFGSLVQCQAQGPCHKLLGGGGIPILFPFGEVATQCTGATRQIDPQNSAEVQESSPLRCHCASVPQSHEWGPSAGKHLPRLGKGGGGFRVVSGQCCRG